MIYKPIKEVSVMKHLYKTHFLSKSFAILLSLSCWLAALFNCTIEHNNSSAQAVTAFSTSSISCPNNSPDITQINKNTFELSYNSSPNPANKNLYHNTFKILKQYDKRIKLIAVYPANSYTDYYLYSPKLCNEKNITPISNGFNIHLAITHSGKIYLGLPYIDFDF